MERIRALFGGLSAYSLWPFPPLAGLEAFSIAAAPPEAVPQTLAATQIPFYLLQQFHSCDYAKLDESGGSGDAWLWHSPYGSGAYGIYTADCIPALLCLGPSPDYAWGGQCGALLHLGRRGIESGLLPKCYRALAQENARLFPRLFLGPGIGVCCYEVPERLARDFCRQAQVSTDCCRASVRPGYQMLDLKRAICEQARTLANIEISVEQLCTSCLARQYRQDGKAVCYSYRQGHRTERIYTIVSFGDWAG